VPPQRRHRTVVQAAAAFGILVAKYECGQLATGMSATKVVLGQLGCMRCDIRVNYALNMLLRFCEAQSRTRCGNSTPRNPISGIASRCAFLCSRYEVVTHVSCGQPAVFLLSWDFMPSAAPRWLLISNATAQWLT